MVREMTPNLKSCLVAECITANMDPILLKVVLIDPAKSAENVEPDLLKTRTYSVRIMRKRRGQVPLIKSTWLIIHHKVRDALKSLRFLSDCCTKACKGA